MRLGSTTLNQKTNNNEINRNILFVFYCEAVIRYLEEICLKHNARTLIILFFTALGHELFSLPTGFSNTRKGLPNPIPYFMT